MSGDRDILLAIKATSEKLRQEITGGVALQDEEGVGLAEQNSLKQIQEEILFQLKVISNNIEALPGKIEESVKIYGHTKHRKSVNELTTSKDVYPVVEIQFRDKESWTNFLLNKVAEIQKHLRISVNGASFKNLTISDIAKSIPGPVPRVPILGSGAQFSKPKLYMGLACQRRNIRRQTSLPAESSRNYMQRRVQERKPLIIEFCNHSDFQLHHPELFLKTGNIFDGLPKFVNSGKREIASFHAGANDIEILGLCSYDVRGTDIKLVVRLEYCFLRKIFPFTWTSYCGLAFTHKDVPMDIVMLQKEMPTVPAAEFDFNKEDRRPKFIQSKNLVASITISAEAGAEVLRIQVLKFVQDPSSLPLDMKAVNKGYTFPSTGSSPDWNVWLGDNDLGCVITIENRLNVLLHEFNWYIDTAKDYVLLPSTITAFTSEMFYVIGDVCIKGMISYKIENTDLRMAAVFWTRLGCQQFSIGFIPGDSALINESTMNSLTVLEPWKTRPYIYANATEGEQVLEYRNIRLSASMTTDAKSALEIIITAF